MSAPGFFIAPQDLWLSIGTASVPCVVDVRRRDVHENADGILPASVWHDPTGGSEWMDALDRNAPVVVACKAGHHLSQITAALLRGRGFDARVLENGYEGWAAAGLPQIDRRAMARYAPRRPSLWVTRRRPKIDRIACPWLIRRCLDPQAIILFVDAPEVANVAVETSAIPFDIADVELSHDGVFCTFDTMLKVFGLASDPALGRMATIIRGADTGRLDIAPEAAGLHAISLGLSVLAADDDHGLLHRGFHLYDGLLAWARHAAREAHGRPARAA